MSNKIHILPDFLMKRISAGEVIERPASVVKELMENALDAGASSVSLYIKNAGVGLIQIIDDGEGMTEEDAVICCERHATSKIAKAEDLESIRSLGFRGEALASIGSISRMEILTRTETDEEGTHVLVEWGKVQEVLKVAARKGTTVSVKDLFFNVPARRKFLKTPATELRHMILVFRRIAIAYPEIDFSLIVEGEKTIDIRRTSRQFRIHDLLGKQRGSQLIPVEKRISNVSVEGFVSLPGESRRNRDDQFFFLNRRYIVNRSLLHSVLTAYGPRLGRNEYPSYVLYIEMDPQQFDVNVHPTKIEVRFSDEKFVHDIVQRAVQDALKTPGVVPRMHFVSGSQKGRTSSKLSYSQGGDWGQMTLEVQRPHAGEQIVQSKKHHDETPLLWQLHNRYILSQIKSGLIIIDQHVAHERILYEKALAAKTRNMGLAQQLLFPQMVEVTPEDFLILTEILPFLEKIGFGLKEFGKNTVVIEAVPIEVKTGREKELLREIIESYREEKTLTHDTWDAVVKAFACKSAIKSGDRLTLDDMASLIDQLFATEDPYSCPHGRPVIVSLSLEEIDKRFGR
ncbi:DNA mismatch repair endonuclease MutL [bacterium]|nr:DNA mismatch repair endonuclease MutL [bacterium]